MAVSPKVYDEIKNCGGSWGQILSLSCIQPLEAKNYPILHDIAVKMAIRGGAVTNKFNLNTAHTMLHPRDVLDRYITKKLYGGKIAEADKAHMSEIGVDVSLLERLMGRKRQRREHEESEDDTDD